MTQCDSRIHDVSCCGGVTRRLHYCDSQPAEQFVVHTERLLSGSGFLDIM